MNALSVDFWLGIVIATVFWLLLSWLYRRYLGYRARIAAANKPQKDKSPNEVVADAHRARAGLVLWAILLIIALFILWEVVMNGTSLSLFSSLQ